MLPGCCSELVLASTSPARVALLSGLGVPFRAEAPGVDEAVPRSLTVQQAVRALALRKAEAVAARSPGALVIGADQLVSLDGQALGKPADREAARAQLWAMSGRTHEIVTGLCLLGPGVLEVEAEVARMSVYPLTPEELERYLDLEEWRGCAGGYRVEGAGQALFERIDGDRTNVQGLPMLLLVRLLRKVGVRFFE
jgi:septum formation protein